MDIHTLPTEPILRDGAAFHFARAVLARSRPKALHQHDAFEMFWLHNGRARHLIADKAEMLAEGDLYLIPPHTPHALQGVGEESHLVNIIIPPATMAAVTAHDTRGLFGAGARLFHRDLRQLSALSHRAVALERAPRSALHIQAFLLTLLAELTIEASDIPDSAPAWLHRACYAARDVAVFSQGAAGLAQAAGKAHAHVSRTMQKHLHQTPSDYINGLRMDHAARQLAGTGDSMSEIAQEVGITNMSHFHRLFRARFGATPRAYRLAHQHGIVQPI